MLGNPTSSSFLWDRWMVSSVSGNSEYPAATIKSSLGETLNNNQNCRHCANVVRQRPACKTGLSEVSLLQLVNSCTSQLACSVLASITFFRHQLNRRDGATDARSRAISIRHPSFSVSLLDVCWLSREDCEHFFCFLSKLRMSVEYVVGTSIVAAVSPSVGDCKTESTCMVQWHDRFNSKGYPFLATSYI